MKRIIVLAVVVVALPIRVSGHHSNAEYDFGVFEEFEGEVVAISWKNPHVRFTLRGSAVGVNDQDLLLNVQVSTISPATPTLAVRRAVRPLPR